MLDETAKNQVKANFEGFLEICDRRAELAKENKALIEDTARILEVKKGTVSKLFKVLKKKHDEATDEIEELSELIELVFKD